MSDDIKTDDDREQERRRDDALRRALAMPPKKHKPMAEKGQKSEGRPRRQKRSTASSHSEP
jgi:hypothetical protein